MLYIVGDIPNSVLSQERRGFVALNAAKSIFGDGECEAAIYHSNRCLNSCCPADPLGILRQMTTFVRTAQQHDEKVVIVRAPYSIASLKEAFRRLGFQPQQVNLDLFHIKQRRSNSTWSNIEATFLAKIDKKYRPPRWEWLHHVGLRKPYEPLSNALDNSPAVFGWDGSKFDLPTDIGNLLAEGEERKKTDCPMEHVLESTSPAKENSAKFFQAIGKPSEEGAYSCTREMEKERKLSMPLWCVAPCVDANGNWRMAPF